MAEYISQRKYGAGEESGNVIFEGDSDEPIIYEAGSNLRGEYKAELSESEKYDDGTGLDTDEANTVRHYIIYAPGKSMTYISPTEEGVTPTDVKKKVDLINKVWETMGITCTRKAVSFDSVVTETDEDGNTQSSADSQIMAMTGLSILKNTHTEDAEYIYRDLKEMLIELGYYTEAEFAYLETDQLEWFIPGYNPESWPQNSGDDVTKFTPKLYYKGEASKDDAKTNNQKLGLEIDRSDGFDKGMEVVAPGDCTILKTTSNRIELKFDATSQPEISMLDGYTMYIEGINTVSPETVEGGIVKAGTKIGETGTQDISVVLMNDRGGYISNVQDYMSPKTTNPYKGTLSQKFYYYLACCVEGLKYTDDEYYTKENGNVEALNDTAQGYITVGPGILMDDGTTGRYIQKSGDSSVNNRDVNSRFKKSVILDMYVEDLDGIYKAAVDNYLGDYKDKLEQYQVEALVMAAYQRGTGSEPLKHIIEEIKAGKSADSLYSLWVTPYKGGGFEGVLKRRYAEWYLFKYGEYIEPYSNAASGQANAVIDFGSDTPWEDFVEGK